MGNASSLNGNFLTLSFFILIFSQYGAFALPVQLSSILILIFLALFNLLIVNATRKIKISIFEVFLFVIALSSLTVNFIHQDFYSTGFSFLFLAVIISMAIIARSVERDVIISSMKNSFILISFFVPILNWNEMINGLSGISVSGIGLLRFTPFNMHPNLVGFMYGGGCVLLFNTALRKSGFEQKLLFISSILLALCVLSASARAGLLSIFLSCLIGSPKALLVYFRRNIKIIIPLFFVFLIGIFFLLDKIFNYFVSILDLESDTRGIGSGGTGRTELWAKGIDTLTGRNLIDLVFGSGLRTASPEKIGFSTESSYITIFLENGILLGSIFILFMFFYFFTFKSKEAKREDYSIVFCVLLFATIQSFFNRYLLAIGNTFSLAVLFFMIIYFRPVRSLLKF